MALWLIDFFTTGSSFRTLLLLPLGSSFYGMSFLLSLGPLQPLVPPYYGMPYLLSRCHDLFWVLHHSSSKPFSSLGVLTLHALLNGHCHECLYINWDIQYDTTSLWIRYLPPSCWMCKDLKVLCLLNWYSICYVSVTLVFAVCKSCVVKFLQNSKVCPQCSLKIHETQPLMNLKADRVMQDIVFKLVPGLYEGRFSWEVKRCWF